MTRQPVQQFKVKIPGEEYEENHKVKASGAQAAALLAIAKSMRNTEDVGLDLFQKVVVEHPDGNVEDFYVSCTTEPFFDEKNGRT